MSIFSLTLFSFVLFGMATMPRWTMWRSRIWTFLSRFKILLIMILLTDPSVFGSETCIFWLKILTLITWAGVFPYFFASSATTSSCRGARTVDWAGPNCNSSYMILKSQSEKRWKPNKWKAEKRRVKKYYSCWVFFARLLLWQVSEVGKQLIIRIASSLVLTFGFPGAPIGE